MSESNFKHMSTNDLASVNGGAVIDTVKLIIKVIDRLADGEFPIFISK